MTRLVKLIFVTLVLVVGVFLFITPATAQEDPLIVDFFDDRLCPVCSAAKEFIQDQQENYPHMELRIYPISDTEKLRQVADSYGVDDYRIMSPTIFIGDNLFQFTDFNDRHREMIIRALEGETIEENGLTVRIPFTSIEFNVNDWSLPLITVILGSLDGFNICSIGALILVLSIVMVLDSKKQMFLYGGIFIFTAVTIYGVMVFAWGRLFETLVGHLEILRIIVGLAALGGGVYFFKEFLRFFRYGPTCQTSNSKMAIGTMNKLKAAFESPEKKPLLLIGSIVSFAIAITIVELPCSIGLPIAYTGILIQSNLSLLNYTLYILAYLFFYMLIELIIFTGAVFTKKIWFAGSKVITWVTFAGSIILFYLAFYYLLS